MRSNTSLRLLLLAAAASPLLAWWPQDPAGKTDEWTAHVEKACTASRYGIRIAAARKVAEGGEAAVPALRAFTQQQGVNALASSLVDAIADSGKQDGLLLDLLMEWASDGDFYWRSSAMRGVALRMHVVRNRDRDDHLGALRFQMLFAGYVDDPAWLMRTHARLGLLVLAGGRADDKLAASMRAEADPRARVRLTRLLLEQGFTPDLQPLLDALAEERTFLDDPWGMRLGAEANKALKAWLGDAYPELPDDAAENKHAAIRALRDAAATRSGQQLVAPAVRSDTVTGTSGVEILSCKHGDLFVQWNEAGELRFGIDGAHIVQLSDTAWAPLSRQLTQAMPTDNLGVVICDSMRLLLREPNVHVKVAPESLPAAATDALKRLARTLEEAGESDLATQLDLRLVQFAGR